MGKYGIVVFLSVLTLYTIPVHAKISPSFKWRQIESDHFLIYFHQGEYLLATEAAQIAECVHHDLVPLIGWEPTFKTAIVLLDDTDMANAMATVLPEKKIIIYPVHPRGDINFSNKQRNWLELLIYHEYTHILHLDSVKGCCIPGRFLFGRIVFPNAFLPLWMIEGWAVYDENRFTTGGRIDGSGYQTMLRVAVKENKLELVDRWNYYLMRWPGGIAPYLYGGSFYKFLAEKYGESYLRKINDYTGSCIFPYPPDVTFMLTQGSTADDLIREWRYKTEIHFEKQIKELEEQGLTPSIQLTRTGYYNRYPAYSYDGKWIAYSSKNPHKYPELRLMRADGSEDRRLCRAIISGKISWHPDGNSIAYCEYNVVKNFLLYSELYIYDIKLKKKIRLTHSGRAFDPCFTPDLVWFGKVLPIVKTSFGKNKI